MVTQESMWNAVKDLSDEGKIIIYSDVVGSCSLNKTVDYSTSLCAISGEHIYPILLTDSKWSYGTFSRVVIHRYVSVA